MLEDNVEEVASNLSDVILTDMNTFMTLYFFVDHFNLVHSPLVILVTLLKGANNSNDGADCLVLGMLIL
jgi:hypothetical protein